MKKNKYLKLLIIQISILILISCSKEKEYLSLKELNMTNDWHTMIDNNAIGLSKGWNEPKNFLSNSDKNLSSSTTWATSIDNYRWQKKEVLVGKIDSTKNYYIVLDSIRGNNLLWINGKLADKSVAYKSRKVIDITNFLESNTNNYFITRNENNLKNGAGIDSIWIQKAKNHASFFPEESRKEMIKMTHTPPSYHDSLIIYETFIRSISTNGTFDGMYYKVPYLKNLGINMVWLMPIHPIGRVKRKGIYGSPYSVKDYFATNSNYGTKEQFANMQNRLKQNDIKLIIDAVVNHTAWDNSLVRNHPEYYTKNDSDEIIFPTNTNWTDVADLDYSNENLRKYMISYFNYWITEMNIDGFRCDVSEMVPMEFWNNLRTNFSTNNTKPFMLAEGTKPQNLGNGFDAVYGWDLYNAFQEIHKDPLKSDKIYQVLASEIEKYPKNSEVMHFAENHDTERGAKTLGHSDHNLALFFIFTSSGIPMIYCGEELGNTEKLDLFNKTTIDWNIKNRTTYNLVKEMIRLRKSSEELLKGDLKSIKKAEYIAGFSRTFENSKLTIIGNYDSVSKIYECSADSIIYSDKDTKLVENGIQISAKGYCIFK
ncbi:MAG: alpha-amylase family glycosyl hydrolase [Candidatus Marinimicrobia bacterium]|nr:alpha-amylase family glycosyl hydrolase [Candidatus Neomarinimicrobiota bacterium]